MKEKKKVQTENQERIKTPFSEMVRKFKKQKNAVVALCGTFSCDPAQNIDCCFRICVLSWFLYLISGWHFEWSGAVYRKEIHGVRAFTRF